MNTFLQKFKNIESLDIIYISKIVFAIMIGYGIAPLLPWEHSSWLLITIVVVMSFHIAIGTQLHRGILRIVGTLLGALIGLVGILFNAHWIVKIFFIILMCYIFLMQTILYKNWRYVGVLACATFLIIITSPGNPITLAYQRIVEIMIGFVIAISVSLYVKPISASQHGVRLIQQNWKLFLELTHKVLSESLRIHSDTDEVHDYENKLRDNLVELHNLETSLKYEKHKNQQQYFNKMDRYQSAIYRYLTLIEVTLSEYLDNPLHQSERLKNALHHIGEILEEDLGFLLGKKGNINTVRAVDIKKELLRTELGEHHFQTENVVTSDSNAEHINACSTLAFATERTVQILQAAKNLTLQSD